MNHVHLSAVPEEEQRSPGGKFHSFCRNLSLAIGGVRSTGTWGGGHPFDLQIRRLPPGAAVCPFHQHLVQWEMFVVRSGEGTVRSGAERHVVKAGEAFLQPPGTPHQLINTATSDLEVLIVADNPPLDLCYYPDSNKWGGRAFGGTFRMTPTDYFAGEEEPPANAPAGNFAPPPPPQPAPIAPFASRRVRLDDLPWEDWSSTKGKFGQAGRQISIPLGAKHRQPLSQGGHPFDLELGKVAPGKIACPFHFHTFQWECYLFLGGRGEFRLGDERFAVSTDDLVMAPPGVAHTFANTGTEDLLYLLIADDPAADYWYYPDSGKWGFSKPRKIFRATEVEYWDGEE